MYSQLLKGGMVVDPERRFCRIADVAIEDGRIAEVADSITAPAREVTDCTGLVVQPGIIDTHLHVTLDPAAYATVVHAGVTTCLDMMGPAGKALSELGARGAGLNVAVLNAILPGKNVAGNDPKPAVIERFIDESLASGAFGVKLLGGHYPLTPQATADFFRVADEKSCYAAFHAGSTQAGSNILGFEEAMTLFDGHRAHLAHINAYCRGYVDSELNECRRGAALLEAHPEVVCESYVSPRNGGSLRFTAEGVPESHVICATMKHLGYEPTKAGAEKAFWDGVLGAVKETPDHRVGLVSGPEGYQWALAHPDCGISFDRVNPVLPRVFFATARRKDGTFLVDGISTDGGALPRNVIVTEGLSLVKLGGLSLIDFAAKTSLLPARLLKLSRKGRLSPGADADITVYCLATQQPVMSFIGGEKALFHGRVANRPGRVICTAAGAAGVRAAGLESVVVDGGVPTLDRRF